MEIIENKLVKYNWITPNQLLKAKEEQQKTKKSLYAVLLKLGYLTEDDIFLFFAQESKIPYVRLSDYKLDEDLLKIYSEDVYRQRLFIPLFKIENTLYIAVANPLDTDLISTIETQTNFEVFPLFSSPTSIIEALDRFFGPDDRYFKVGELIVAPNKLKMVPLWRESQRLAVNIPIEVSPCDERVKLVSSSYISGTCIDISQSGKAIGVKTFIFLPPKVKVNLRFNFKNKIFETKAEIARINMGEGGYYFIGMKFLQPEDEIIKNILEEATKGLKKP